MIREIRIEENAEILVEGLNFVEKLHFSKITYRVVIKFEINSPAQQLSNPIERSYHPLKILKKSFAHFY